MSGSAQPLRDDYAAWAEGLLRAQAELVAEMAKGAARMAAAIEAKAGAEPTKQEAMAYTRLYRAARMGSLLLERMVQDIGKVRSVARCESEHDDRQAILAAALADPAHDHKSRVERIVERIAAAEHGDDEDAIDRLVRECGERLDDEDIWRDVRVLPVKTLVRQLCDDLKLDWSPFAHEAWARDDQDFGPAHPPPRSGGGGPEGRWEQAPPPPETSDGPDAGHTPGPAPPQSFAGSLP